MSICCAVVARMSADGSLDNATDVSEEEFFERIEARIWRGGAEGVIAECQQLLADAGSETSSVEPGPEQDRARARYAGRCWATIGLAHVFQRRTREAMDAVHLAIDHFHRSGDNNLLAVVLTRAAVSYARLGESTQCLRMLGRAHDIVSGLRDDGLAFRLFNNMGVAYVGLGSLERAADSLRRAAEVAKRLPDPRDVLDAEANLVAVEASWAAELLGAGRVTEGHALLTNVQTRRADLTPRAHMHGSEHLIIEMLLGEGRALAAAGRRDEAQDTLMAGVRQLHRGQADPRTLSDFWITLAQLRRTAGDLAQSAHYLDLVMETAESLEDEQLFIDYHLERAAVHEADGALEDALAQFRRYEDMMLDQFRRRTDVRSQVMAAQVGRDSAQLESDILLLRAVDLADETRDIQERAQQLSQVVLEDPLTRVGNRRRLREVVGRLRAEGSEHVSVILLDLDHFKDINDTYSHAVGDRVLVQVAALVSRGARSADVVCRTGGEEFVMVARDMPRAAAAGLAERLRRRVMDHPWDEIHPGLRVTASFGVAAGSANEVADLMKAADRALYRAKRAGRNRVRQE